MQKVAMHYRSGASCGCRNLFFIWPLEKLLGGADEGVGLFVERNVAAAFEDDEARAGNGLVNFVGDERRDVDVVPAGHHDHGKFEFRNFGIEIETRQIAHHCL